MDFVRILRSGITPIACLATVSVFSAAWADGLIQQLPEDGSWVRFEMEIQYFDPRTSKPRRTFTGSQTVSSVGKSTVDDEPCRMIELKTVRRLPDQTGEETDHLNIYKFAIPEKRLKAGEDPLEFVEQGWAKVRAQGERGQPPASVQLEMDLSREFRNFLWFELPGPLEDLRKLDAEMVECKAGKYTCEGVAGTAKGRLSPELRGPEYQFQYETRTHKDVPFGVVRHRCEAKAHFPDGQLAQHTVVTYTLAQIGKNAKSEISEEESKK